MKTFQCKIIIHQFCFIENITPYLNPNCIIDKNKSYDAVFGIESQSIVHDDNNGRRPHQQWYNTYSVTEYFPTMLLIPSDAMNNENETVFFHKFNAKFNCDILKDVQKGYDILRSTIWNYLSMQT